MPAQRPLRKMVVDQIWSKFVFLLVHRDLVTWLLTIFSSDSKLESYNFELQVKFDLESGAVGFTLILPRGKRVPEPEFTPS